MDTGSDQVVLEKNVSLTTLLHRHKRLVPEVASPSSVAPVSRIDCVSGLN